MQEGENGGDALSPALCLGWGVGFIFDDGVRGGVGSCGAGPNF